MVVPHHVDTQSIKPKSFNHFDSVFPVLDRDPRIVNLSRKNLIGQAWWFLPIILIIKLENDAWKHDKESGDNYFVFCLHDKK